MNPAIVVVAYNRDRSLKRLLSSISKARIPSGVDLIISIDASDNNRVYDIAKSFCWEYGKKEVIARAEHLGLKRHILECGDLSIAYGAVIVLEDDLFVSPLFYEYAKKAADFFANEEIVAGVSLYSERYNETSQMAFYPIEDDSDVFFLQWPSSWGQCWIKEQWQGFRQWLREKEDRDIFESLHIPHNVRSWPDDSWKKYFLAYLVDTNKYFVYPRTGLSSNFGDSGAHHRKKETLFQVPLQYSEKDWRFKKIDNSFAVYDAFHEILPAKLKTLARNLDKYELAVDFYGQKDLERLQQEYLITGRGCSLPIRTYGRHLKPVELNVIYGIEGSDINLGPKTSCEQDFKTFTTSDLIYYYGNPSCFISLEHKVQVKEEAINNYYYNYYNHLIKEVYNSKSWRLTAPLRKLYAAVREFRAKFRGRGPIANEISTNINCAIPAQRAISQEVKQFSAQEKVNILRQHLIEKVPVQKLCIDYGIDSETFYHWQKELFERGKYALDYQNVDMPSALWHLANKGFNPKVILDIGAGKGYWAAETARVFPNAEYFMIDPLIENEETLSVLCKFDQRFHYLLLAVGSESGSGNMHICPECDRRSLLKYYDEPSTQTQRQVNVETVDNLVSNGQIKPPDLVKIDVEGYEMKVLQGGQRMFDSAEVFIIETNLYRFMPECPLADEVIAYMKDKGYRLFDIAGLLRRPYENDLAQMDLVFVRSDSPLVASNRWR